MPAHVKIQKTAQLLDTLALLFVTLISTLLLLLQGQPIMSDDEYDALKAELKLKSSVVAAQGPRCSIRS
jgi:hypothetical protein